MTTDAQAPYVEHYKGMRVPWIARWSGEVRAHDPLSVSFNPRTKRLALGYGDRNEDRDNYGVLWQRENMGRTGEPIFAEVSTMRQRMAMRHRRCQVCGLKLPPGDIKWLVPATALDMTADAPGFPPAMVTTSAPTCEGCINVALASCPHLKANDWQIFLVHDFRIWGVRGEAVAIPGDALRMYVQTGDVRHLRTERLNHLQYPYGFDGGALGAESVLAKQILVEFTDFEDVT